MNTPYRVVYRHTNGKLVTWSRFSTYSDACDSCVAFMDTYKTLAWIACPEHNDDGSYRSVRS